MVFKCSTQATGTRDKPRLQDVGHGKGKPRMLKKTRLRDDNHGYECQPRIFDDGHGYETSVCYGYPRPVPGVFLHVVTSDLRLIGGPLARL